MTPSQIDHARHALGLTGDRRVSYRNHFVTGPGSSDYDDWMEMVKAGQARRRPGSALTGGDDLFWLTHSGALQVVKKGEKLDSSHFPPDIAVASTKGE